MRNESVELNFTHRWERDYYHEKPCNHDFNVLVLDCILQLNQNQTAFCFTDEQKNEIIRRVKFPVVIERQDGIIVLRKGVKI